MTEETPLQKIEKSIAAYVDGASAFKSCASGVSNTFGANASIRSEYGKADYSCARPSERVPTGFLESLVFCNESYYNIAIVRNVMDLMADFCIKGIDWSHPNRNVQSFYREWFSTVDGKGVSERFCNYLFRLGNVAIVNEKSKIPDSVASEWKRTRGSEFKDLKTRNLEIPSSYSFIDVTALREEVDPNNFGISNRKFRVSTSGGLISTFTNYNMTFRSQGGSSFSGRLFQSLPQYLKDRVLENSGNLILTEGEDVRIFHYRKDDWDTWARPIILAIAEPLIMLKKMHLADMSALDGVISNVRLWRLGYIDQTNVLNSIIPSKDMLEKFAGILRANIAGGVLDVVWGPDLDFKESASNSHQFLFPEKYTQLMSEIYDGLGVNPSLAGGSSSGGSGMTNNAISMKVLVERLSYVRNKLIDFWNRESRLIQKAMGFSSAAKIQFDDAIFSDEIAYKKLLMDLYDRDVISLEGLREEYNLVDEIEEKRIIREGKRRDKGRIQPKSSPFHDPMVKPKLQSDLIKNGNLDGEHLGVDVKKEDVFSKNPGGRPTGAKDTNVRQPKKVSPKKVFANSFMEMQTWAKEGLDKVSSIIGDVYLEEKSKVNFRQLNNEEVAEFENLKLSILMNIDPFSEIDNKSVSESLNQCKSCAVEFSIRDELLIELSNKIKRPITMDDKRIASAAAYTISKLSDDSTQMA